MFDSLCLVLPVENESLSQPGGWGSLKIGSLSCVVWSF